MLARRSSACGCCAAARSAARSAATDPAADAWRTLGLGALAGETPVAGEELAAVGEQPGELEVAHVRSAARSSGRGPSPPPSFGAVVTKSSSTSPAGEQLARAGAGRPRRAGRGRRVRRAGERIASARSTLPSWRTTSTGVARLGRLASDEVKISTSPAPDVKSSASQGRSRRPETMHHQRVVREPARSRRARFSGSPTTRP